MTVRPQFRNRAWAAGLLVLAVRGTARGELRLSAPSSSSSDADDDSAEVAPAPAEKGARRAVTLDDGGDRNEEGSAPQPPPSSHTVRKGDTLWDICSRYFRDPWRWPKVWALNPEIENPHWIYPGQTVRLDSEDKGRAMVVATPGASEATDADPRAKVPEPPVQVEPGLKEVGFVDEGGLRMAGTISGSPEEKIMLASGDAAYISYAGSSAPKTPLVLGREYPVYEVDAAHPVRDPESRQTLGYLVYVRGFARIDEANDKDPLARATLIETTDPIERGFRVGEVFRDRITVSPRPAAKTVHGRLAGTVSPNLLIGKESFVVLNKGRTDGVLAGNRFKVVRRGDGYKNVMDHWEGDDPAFPPNLVGDILAVDVREHTTIGWVSRAAVELRVGDAVSLTQGQ